MGIGHELLIQKNPASTRLAACCNLRNKSGKKFVGQRPRRLGDSKGASEPCPTNILANTIGCWIELNSMNRENKQNEAYRYKVRGES